MKLAAFLFRHDRRTITLIAILGMLGGLASAGLVAIVNRALHNPPQRLILLGIFTALVLTKILSAIVSSLFLVRLSQTSVERLLNDLCRRVLAAPFGTLESIGSARILATLTDDTAVLAAAIQAIPPLAMNLAVLVGCTAYLGYLSWVAAGAMLGFAALGTLVYRVLLKKAYLALRLAQDGRDRLFQHLRGLTDGIKELKLSEQRRQNFLAHDFGEALKYVKENSIAAMNRYVVADAWNQAIFYLLMGTMLFALTGIHRISQETLSGYVFTALYAAGPIFGIIAALPVFNRGQSALDRIESLGLPEESEGEEPRPKGIATPPLLEFRGVRFSYNQGDGPHQFALGPIDLTIEPGELVFLIGGNGSGKTTFMKLLTGLYNPSEGEIRVDGNLLEAGWQKSYRELFSAVYSDFYLFHRLPTSASGLEENSRAYLAQLELSKKVHVENGCLSTTALSQGQRRRLALLSAYLEDRPIYVLDEWAADQDPAYRQIFYTRLLPELKARGKTVIVVTHDDRYFHLGDKIFKLDYGQIVEMKAPARGNGMAAASF